MKNLMREKKYDNFRFERKAGSERIDLIPAITLCKGCADKHRSGEELPNVKNVGKFIKNAGYDQCWSCCQEFKRTAKYEGELAKGFYQW